MGLTDHLPVGFRIKKWDLMVTFHQNRTFGGKPTFPVYCENELNLWE